MQKLRRAGFLVAAGVWMGAMGCGAPDAQPDVEGRQGAQMSGSAPDFVITEVKGPANVLPGQPFKASVRVCNQGTEAGYTDVELYLSEDAVITPSWPGPGDYPLGMEYVGWLEPGQCISRQVQAHSWAPEGIFYLGAYVDPFQGQMELREDNNAYVGGRLGVGYGPDFVITEVKGPANVWPGQSFTASVKVCNQGTWGEGTEVGLYLSEDAVITPGGPEPGDYPLGMEYVGWLEPGQCATRQVQAQAWVPEGVFYLGAYVDPYQGRMELQEENNAYTGAKLGVGYGPDFVITEVKGPANVRPGEPFTASVKVCNQGTQGESADVELYLSEDSVITPGGPMMGDYPLGMAYVGWLSPGQCATRQVQAHSWVPEGVFYLGAYVDPYQGRMELQEENNAYAGAKLGVGYGPDFVVTEVKGPANVWPGQSFTVSVKVCNQGTRGESTEVELYLSEDSVITPGGPMMGDYPLGMEHVGWLEPGQCATRQVQTHSWVPEGVFYLGAYVDPYRYRPELQEDNNAFTGAKLGVGHEPDFVVTEVKGPANVRPGEPFTASVKVCNQGPGSGYTDVELYLSEDSVITPGGPMMGDYPLGMAYVGWLNAGQCATRQVQAQAWAPHDGVFYLGAYADPYGNEAELQEDNNAYVGAKLGVGHGPDFIVTEVKGPANVKQGEPFMASVRVCNQGTLGESTDVALSLSEDAVIMPRDPTPGDYVQMVSMGWLEPGQCITRQTQLHAWVPEGTFYLGAFVNLYQHWTELQGDNNAYTGAKLGVGYGPDFVVTEVKGPASVRPGEPFTASVKVCNQGTRGESADVELYLSEDSVITPGGPMMGDYPLGMESVGWLEPGQCATRQVQAYAWVPEGAFYLGAYVDPYRYRPELQEDNNAFTGAKLGVGFKPDFVVTEVQAPLLVRMGDSFSATVTVCNQGTEAGSTEVELYFSEDAVITPNFPGPGSEDFFAGGVPTGHLEPGQCSSLPISAFTWTPQDGVFYLGAYVDSHQQRAELIESNNAHAGQLVFVQP